jgi:LysM repeat protein
MLESGGIMATLEELKSKYQTVLQRVQVLGIQVTGLHQMDQKLVIKGIAPSLDAANKIWDEIRSVNPRVDDIIADFPVKTAARPQSAGSAQAERPQAQTYVVRPGDTLSSISRRFYGNTSDYLRIFNANKEHLKDPNQIKVGQELKIPPAA